MQVFVDLYEALRQVHELALDKGEADLIQEVSGHLSELMPIIQREVQPNLEVAQAAADWLYELVETNLETQGWNVSNSTHISPIGDNPQMARNAAHPYKPSSDFEGNFADPLPVSDGAWRMGNGGALAGEMRNRAWGNSGGNQVYPSLKNPYVDAPFGDYKIKGEKHIDSDSGNLAHAGSGTDTWPGLQNPYTPSAETPQSYKMNHGKEPDLVVDQ